MADPRAVLDLTDITWSDHVPQAGRPILIQFWAPWSGPCRHQRQIVDRLADLFGARVAFFRVNVDDTVDVARKIGVVTVPLIIAYDRAGHLVQKAPGLQSETILQRLLYHLVE